jgi:acyl dehydratase
VVIETEKAVGTRLQEASSTWTWKDVVLYHLGLGAGSHPTDPKELAYTYENGLQVLPTYAVILATPAVRGLDRIPGLVFDHSRMLHGEQEISLDSPIPTSGTVQTTAEVAAIYDKGTAALTVLEAQSRTPDGRLLFVNRYSLFMRGAGGFGGDPGPKDQPKPPDREPDRVVEVQTLPQQALIYRLSGDLNPLHADPEYAARGGFARPILHGLCTYGIVCKAAVDSMLDADPGAVRGYRARFAGVVYPGETLAVRLWRENGDILLEATVKERGAPALSNGLIRTG